MTSIVIPTYTPAHMEPKLDEFVRPTLEGLYKHTSLDKFETVVVANGCTAKTKDLLQEYTLTYPNFRFLWFDQGQGFTRATNIGIKEAKGEFIVMLNDDAVILPSEVDGWLNWMQQPMLSDPQLGMTGVHKLWCSHSQADFLVGFLVMMRRTMLEEIGLLDEVFNPGAGEDTDLCIRALHHGWKWSCVDNTVPAPDGSPFMVGTFPIWHKGEATMHNLDGPGKYESWTKIFHKNSVRLAERKASGYYDKKQPLVATIPTLPLRKQTLRDVLTRFK